MIEVSRVMPVPPERVWAVLADGWSYAGWVVGNAHIRDVDADWPAEGSVLHHKAGMWPVQVPDVSTVAAASPGSMLELDARLWVLGRGRVRVSLERLGESATRVTIAERAVSGPARLVPLRVQKLVLGARNAETLARLQDMAVNRPERRTVGPGHDDGGADRWNTAEDR
ncbi:SRPBCC family protein [Saccharomonospora saliphila]|uniref:SRPBCC family protein n=1 Tax=Saccharomonospora saliphila TaxID=369829 RepID=UPI0003659686|nr:SRPBCC family protein [Saccharomonospora saliphila]